jgi:hypothetical protein
VVLVVVKLLLLLVMLGVLRPSGPGEAMLLSSSSSSSMSLSASAAAGLLPLLLPPLLLSPVADLSLLSTAGVLVLLLMSVLGDSSVLTAGVLLLPLVLAGLSLLSAADEVLLMSTEGRMSLLWTVDGLMPLLLLSTDGRLLSSAGERLLLPLIVYTGLLSLLVVGGLLLRGLPPAPAPEVSGNQHGWMCCHCWWWMYQS